MSIMSVIKKLFSKNIQTTQNIKKIKKTYKGVELISVHIPKTAGTSFFSTLQNVYGEDAVQRVDIRPGDEKSLAKRAAARENPKVLSDSIKVLHGHFTYHDVKEFYGLEGDIPVITWIRDPAERLISDYYYLSKVLRSMIPQDHKNAKLINRMEKSLIEFARSDKNRNRITTFLSGVALKDFDFVGIKEKLEEDIEDLAYLLEWDKYEIFHHNINSPHKKEVDKALKEEIAELNRDDVDLYEEALRLRQERRNKLAAEGL